MSKNENLRRAKIEKNDEFYTLLSDIENEVSNYTEQLKGKLIYCNCDNPHFSNFWRYFKTNFKALELKGLVSTYYTTKGKSFRTYYDGKRKTKTRLSGNGDFRSPECIEILKEADIVITNPPFSLFREFIATIEENKKKYLIIGNQNAITYKETFLLIRENKLWLGFNCPKEFKKPDRTIQKFGNICWFTNLDNIKRYKDISYNKKYSNKDYPKYDNYDAININRVSEIPIDYEGVMGVPITFLYSYNPKLFEIIGTSNRDGDNIEAVNKIRLTDKKEGCCIINGNKVYIRIFIKRKK